MKQTRNSESANEISPPIEVVRVKEEIADNCVLEDGNVLKGEEPMKEKYEFSTLGKPENIKDNMQYSSSLNDEHHILENFLNRVKKETGFNLISEEIEIKDENLFEATDFDSEDTSNEPDYNSTLSEGSKNRRKDQNVNSTKRFQCDKCHKEFSYPSYLKRHSRIHTGDRPFECTTCKKTFATITNLRIHNRAHTDEKPYECDVCKKKFNTKSHLIVHKRTHDNERPFKCSVCQMAFTVGGILTAHMRTHTGEKPYQCQVCQYKSTTRSALKNHIRVHTGEKQFKCDHCHKAFGRGFKRHMQMHHTDKI